MAARSYTANRSERIARITGEAWEFTVNDGDPYACRTGMTGPAVQARAIEVQRVLNTTGTTSSGGSVAEDLLREIVDPSMHDRLAAEFRSTDPHLMIVLTDKEAAEVVRDFIEFLAGGVPFEQPQLSLVTPSKTGGVSEPTSQRPALVEIH